MRSLIALIIISACSFSFGAGEVLVDCIDNDPMSSHYKQAIKRPSSATILNGVVGGAETLRDVSNLSDNQTKSTYLLGSGYDAIFSDSTETTGILRVSEDLFSSSFQGVDIGGQAFTMDGGATFFFLQGVAGQISVPVLIQTAISGSPVLKIQQAGSNTDHLLGIFDSSDTEWAYFIPATQTFFDFSDSGNAISGVTTASTFAAVRGGGSGSGTIGVEGTGGDRGGYFWASGIGPIGLNARAEGGESAIFQSFAYDNPAATVVIKNLNEDGNQQVSDLLHFDDPTSGTIASVNSYGDAFFPNVTANSQLSASALRVVEGSNASMGRATLSSGTVTVSTNKATTTMEVFLTNRILSGVAGVLSVGTVVGGTSFVINSSTGAADNSDVSWLIIEPAP